MVDGRPQRVRFDPVANFSFAALAPWAGLAIAPGSYVLPDGLLGLDVLEMLGDQPKVVVVAPKEKAGHRD